MKEIEEHLGDTTYARGIIGIREKGIKGLFAERTPLYKKCAQCTIATSGLATEEIVKRIRSYVAL